MSMSPDTVYCSVQLVFLNDLFSSVSGIKLQHRSHLKTDFL